MTPVACFSGRNVALFGLGGSGLASARALIAGGARVAAWDDNASSREKATLAEIEVVDLNSADWAKFDCLILAPGVPLTHPAPHWTVAKARAAKIEVIGDIELFSRQRAKLAPGAPFIAVTGTNGKSTTTALIAHILLQAGKDVQMGGNIGTPVLALEPPAENRFHVIECSSFQIDLAPSIAPAIGVLLNLTPDHLDRHGTMDNYAAVKSRLVESADIAVIGIDDGYCTAVYQSRLENDDGERRAVAISNHRPEVSEIIYFEDSRLCREISISPQSYLAETLVDLRGARALRGAHNGQNAAAAFSVCEWLGIPHDEIGAGMKSFPGLPHRMEEVGKLGNILFVNDSKATNADAAEKALLSFNDIFWIIGGKSKEGGIEPLKPLFGKVQKAYLIGAASDDFARTLDGALAYERCGALEVAIERAARDAAASNAREPVVMLSPACASYDQFSNFEVRGDRFRDLARVLIARSKNAKRSQP